MIEENIYTEEEENLERCISRIDEIIDEDKRFLGMSKENAPVFGEAARDMRQKKEENIRNLSEARQSPYFGRIDFVRETTPDSIASYYLGEYHIPLDYVFNWRVLAATQNRPGRDT